MTRNRKMVRRTRHSFLYRFLRWICNSLADVVLAAVVISFLMSIIFAATGLLMFVINAVLL